MKKIKLMIVEDELITASAMRRLFRALGYDVCLSTSFGDETITGIAREKPDFLIIDIMLHGELDGIQVAEQIRSRFDIPIAFTTSYNNKILMQRARAIKPIGLFIKPVDSRDLQSAITSSFQA
jgi:CheY-like chemotaxis protein